jgi:hypothetical protein
MNDDNRETDASGRKNGAAERAAEAASGRRPGRGGFLGLRRESLVILIAIAVLLGGLSFLSQPADSSSAGGALARLRVQNGLSQANLGEIDPTSETMRLAMLGLKTVAVTLLWDRANHYKKVEDWTSLSATLEQMTKLQPNFYSIWDFQAHNLSYNISVEFDDYHDRYAWVMKGIEFLRQGIQFNRMEPRLLGRMGWFIGQKIGKADEKVQYRRLFKADDDFHERDRPGRTLQERDNWLVAREKYVAAQQLADSGVPLNTTPLIFHSEPMMMAINYAKAVEGDGTFGDVARNAWRLAGEEMNRFAFRDIPTTWNVPIRLALREENLKTAEDRSRRLEALLPGRAEALREEKRRALSPEQREALDKPPAERDDKQSGLAAAAEAALKVTWRMVAREAPVEVRDEARRLAAEQMEAAETAEIIGRYRDIVNFDFWRATCQAEVTEPALQAREATWRAEREYENARLQTARKAYEEAFAAWRKVLDGSKVLREDPLTADDLAEIVARYRKVLEQLDEPFPEPFVLQDVLDRASPSAGG